MTPNTASSREPLRCAFNHLVLLSSVLSNPAYFGTSGRRLTPRACGGSRKKPQTVANRRPAALEKV